MEGHLVPLVEGWALWRSVCLRGAGFPAKLLQSLAQPELVAQVDALLDAEASVTAAFSLLLAKMSNAPDLRRARRHALRGRLPAAEDVAGVAEEARAVAEAALLRRDLLREKVAIAIGPAREATTGALQAVATNPRFREAIVSQNRIALATGVDLVRRSRGTSQDRRHEELVASYLHRYCAKNDSVGFYGPIGWAIWDDHISGIRARPGPTIATGRKWHFEGWGIDEIARVIARIPGVRSWLRPRRYGFVSLSGQVADSTLTGPIELDALGAAVLLASDGTITARAITIPGAEESDIAAALESLEAKGLLEWSFDIPVQWRPEDALVRQLEDIADEELRARALAPLLGLNELLAGVDASIGDPDRLADALGRFDAAFSEATGRSARQDSGAMYASRTLLFEDACRDFDLRLGTRIREEIAPALSLVLESARWLTYRCAEALAPLLDDLYDRLAPSGGEVPFAELWFGAQRYFLGSKENISSGPCVAACEAWTAILAPEAGASRVVRSSRELAPLVARAFAAPRAGWTSARHHSPDIMLAATSADEIERGNYFCVLGETHVALNTMVANVLVAHHPDPSRLVEALTLDLPEPQVSAAPAKRTQVGNARIAHTFAPASAWAVDSSLGHPHLGPERVIALADITVSRENGELVARSRTKGLVATVLEIFGHALSESVINGLELLPRSDHTPRVTIDRLVVRREAWTVAPSALAFAGAKDELELVVAARAWARSLGLPRLVFVKSPLEQKPIYVDFESVVSLRILARIVRQARDHGRGEHRVTVSEMLPDLDQLWLTDDAGNRYTSELRLVAVDQKR